MSRLANKNILITGGNSGIGLAAALEFDREGARIVICGLNEGSSGISRCLTTMHGTWQRHGSPWGYKGEGRPGIGGGGGGGPPRAPPRRPTPAPPLGPPAAYSRRPASCTPERRHSYSPSSL